MCIVDSTYMRPTLWSCRVTLQYFRDNHHSHCSLRFRVSAAVQGVSSIVWLAPVPYYATLDGGPVSFTINLWFKAGDTTGGLFQYMFSHMGDPDGSEWGPNQVSGNITAQHDTICTDVMCTHD